MSDPRHLTELRAGRTEDRGAAIAVVDPDEKKVGEQHRKGEQPDRATNQHREGEHRNAIERHAWGAQRDCCGEHTHGAEQQRNDETTERQEREAY